MLKMILNIFNLIDIEIDYIYNQNLFEGRCYGDGNNNGINCYGGNDDDDDDNVGDGCVDANNDRDDVKDDDLNYF